MSLHNKVYIFGHNNITWNSFVAYYESALHDTIQTWVDAEYLVCDARGCDTLTMEWLKTQTDLVTVHHMFEKPRYLPDTYKSKVSSWSIQGGFISDKHRDTYCVDKCTHFVGFSSRPDSSTQKLRDLCLEKGKIDLTELVNRRLAMVSQYAQNVLPGENK